MSKDKVIGTTHFPHGYLGINSSFNGLMPTIDSSIWKHHTFVIEVEKMSDITEKHIVRMIGRDKDNPSDRTAGNKNLEQKLELNSKGMCNTISTVQKDNMVLENASDIESEDGGQI